MEVERYVHVVIKQDSLPMYMLFRLFEFFIEGDCV